MDFVALPDNAVRQAIDACTVGVLQRAYKSLQRKPGQNETAINDRDFEVDFLHRMAQGVEHRCRPS